MDFRDSEKGPLTLRRSVAIKARQYTEATVLEVLTPVQKIPEK